MPKFAEVRAAVYAAKNGITAEEPEFALFTNQTKIAMLTTARTTTATARIMDATLIALLSLDQQLIDKPREIAPVTNCTA